MSLQISAIVCAHNPREDFFGQVLQGLQDQSLSYNYWEVLIIDNMSSIQISTLYKIDWHPNSKLLVEPNLGLAFARKRGYEEAKGQLIICIDDDVILDKDYLKNAWEIYNNYPFIGVFGCQIKPKFEKEPTLKIEYYGNAQRIVEKDVWSNDISDYKSTPFGAGMCIRKELSDKYLEILKKDMFRLKLGRRGNQLLSCEDIDLVFAACELGYGKGMFKRLTLTHFVPEKKMSFDYLIKNNYWNAFSYSIQNYYLFNETNDNKKSLPYRIYDLLRLLKMDKFSRQSELAKRRGIKDALQAIQNGDY